MRIVCDMRAGNGCWRGMRPAAFSAADSSLDAGDPNWSVSTFSQPEGLDHLLHSDQGRWVVR